MWFSNSPHLFHYIHLCVWPPPSNSHHQDYYIFSRGSLSTFIPHWHPGRGTPRTVLFCEIASNMTCFHYEFGLAKQHGGCKQDINHFRLIHQPEKSHPIEYWGGDFQKLDFIPEGILALGYYFWFCFQSSLDVEMNFFHTIQRDVSIDFVDILWIWNAIKHTLWHLVIARVPNL